MRSVIDGMLNKVEYALKNSRNMIVHLEEYSASKVLQSGLNVRTFKILFGGGW